MKILALEFSSLIRSVAVFEEHKELASCRTESRDEGPFSLIESALKAAGCSQGDIDCIAIGRGPGSYTGIRSAIAIAQGWQLASGVKLCGVSSVEAIARQAHVVATDNSFAVLIDAQRGEFYCAQYETAEGLVREVSPLRIVSGAAVEEMCDAGVSLIGPHPRVAELGGVPVWPDAKDIAETANENRDFAAGETIEPIYLREVAFVKSKPVKF